jgi:hypothetical protein
MSLPYISRSISLPAAQSPSIISHWIETVAHLATQVADDRFIDVSGANHLVRWSMEPTVSPTPVSHALASMGPEFFECDLVRRLADSPLTRRLVVTFARSQTGAEGASE